MTLTKAQLFEITNWPDDGTPETGSEPYVTVQFNPASLKVTYSNQVETEGQGPNSAMQYVGKGDSKLAVELIFDVSGAGATDTQDVRRMTKKVAHFLEPQEEGAGEEKRFKVPAMRFQWGSFLFDGVLVSMDETLELWSENGNPLRATVSISLSQPGIQFKFRQNPQATQPPSGTQPSGRQPLTPAAQGDNVQNLVANSNSNQDWKAIAAQNGIENPRNLTPGTLLNLQVEANVSVGSNFVTAGGSLNV